MKDRAGHGWERDVRKSKKKKKKVARGSHCHANWCLVQTPVSCKGILKGKVRYKRLWHHLLSVVRVVNLL